MSIKLLEQICFKSNLCGNNEPSKLKCLMKNFDCSKITRVTIPFPCIVFLKGLERNDGDSFIRPSLGTPKNFECNRKTRVASRFVLIWHELEYLNQLWWIFDVDMFENSFIKPQTLLKSIGKIVNLLNKFPKLYQIEFYLAVK